jgi:hypothetical protein
MDHRIGMTLVTVVDVASEDVAALQQYEAAVLPLLNRHRARLERRLRTPDARTEVHVISFGSRAAYDAYVADPERMEHRRLLEGRAVSQRVLEVLEVDEIESRCLASSTLTDEPLPDAPFGPCDGSRI